MKNTIASHSLTTTRSYLDHFQIAQHNWYVFIREERLAKRKGKLKNNTNK